MGDVSNNFSRHEFACKCGCGFDTVDVELLEVLQWLRDDINMRVIITSGCRCHANNIDIGGSPSSQHLIAKAADIQVKGIHPKDIYNLLDSRHLYKYGLGIYDKHVHVDVRRGKVRWDKRLTTPPHKSS